MATIAIDRPNAMTLQNNPNHVHPFFSKSKNRSTDRTLAGQTEAADTRSSAYESADSEAHEPPRKRGRPRKKHGTSGQRSILQGFGLENTRSSTGIEQAELEADPNHDRRKRRKTQSPVTERQEAGVGVEDVVLGDIGVSYQDDRPDRLQKEADGTSVFNASMQVATESIVSKQEHDNTDETFMTTRSTDIRDDEKPIRTMRLRGGKLASPRPAKQRSKTGGQTRSQLIVKISYATRLREIPHFGSIIQSVLDDEAVVRPVQKLKMLESCSGFKQDCKVTHPFFLGKSSSAAPNDNDRIVQAHDPRDAEVRTSPLKTSATTPGKLRAAREAYRLPIASALAPMQSIPTARRAPKHTGMQPSWPSKDSLHVRDFVIGPCFSDPTVSSALAERSSKRRVLHTVLREDENILSRILPSVDGCPHPRPRLPRRQILAGSSIHTRIENEILSKEGLPWKTGNQLPQSRETKIRHPALVDLSAGLEQYMSPFDRFACDNQTWSLKYAPRKASHVLQSGKEAFILHDWLKRSTISAVKTGSNRSTASSTKSSAKIARGGSDKRKPRKKKKDQDDFVVESDDDPSQEDELLPVSDPNRADSAPRSYVRGGDNYERATPGSTILISGPHGCGKTAAIYAVAKELGFEIFEINSASRRSGRDILDKIGDMTENHLVQQVSKALNGNTTSKEDKPAILSIQASDLPDPKQKSMASFFKTSAAGPKSQTNSCDKPSLSKAVLSNKVESQVARQKQKQSLILLEEVDVLFEEDKQFWMTILTLATHSKRPIVMTCTDDRFVPIASLTLHAVLHFVAPPLDLASDYLLLLAGREGHLLRKEAVQSLYLTKRSDLRASITEMNFWCQMAVGDPTKGFRWMIDRYPSGVDLDEHGRVLRAASEGTYIRGLGVVPHDLETTAASGGMEVDPIWSQVWDEWGLKPVEAEHERQGLYHANGHPLQSDTGKSLEWWHFASELLSASDVSTGIEMRPLTERTLACDLPAMSPKTARSYALSISGNTDILDTDTWHDHTKVDQNLAIATHAGIARLLIGSRASVVEGVDLIQAIESKVISRSLDTVDRSDFSLALDPLASVPDDSSALTGTYMSASSIDREFSTIVTEIAPYVRSIAREHRWHEEQRIRLSSLLSAGGQRRTTRNAYAAMDGGQRSDRTWRYFEDMKKLGVDIDHILATGGKEWIAQKGRSETVSTANGAEVSPRGTQASE